MAKFYVGTEVLTIVDGHEKYDEVMQDILVNKTGRYRLVSKPTQTIDQTTGDIRITFEYIDNGEDQSNKF